MSYEITRYSSIDQVPREKWDSMAPRDRICLETDHLKAIEHSGINNIKPFYLLASREGTVEGIANFFLMDMDFSGFGNDISPTVQKSLKCWFPDFLEMKMLECGLISGIGEAIWANEEAFTSILPLVIKEMDQVANKEHADISLIRDIPYDKFDRYYNCLSTYGYEPILGFPSAILNIPGNDLVDYFNSLKSHSRGDINKHLSMLSQPEISIEVIQDFGQYADRLISLSEQVSLRAETYEHEKLNLSYFKQINKYFPTRSYIIAIKRYNEIIAFSLCLEGDKEIFAIYVGLDYKFNQQYQLYFNQHFLCINEAMKRGKNIINFGITTYDFKLVIGCELQPLVYFIKHNITPNLTHALAKMLKDAIKQPENYHRPFKNQDLSTRVQLKDIEKQIGMISKQNDIFDKANSYVRPNLLKIANMYSFFPGFESAQQKSVEYRGKKVIMLGSNSYLGLSSHPDVRAAAKKAIDKYGTGCSGSPFLNGTLDIHVDLAKALAKFMQKDDALLFSTGYQTNLGTISAIAGRHDVLILDSLDHASIMDAAKFSYADVARYDHDDMESLEKVLKENGDKNKLIVVDSVFSMEGTIANIPEIVRLSKKYNARLMLDEAHGIGVLGPGGRGAAEHFGLLDQIDIIMGTFSKSFAAVGGFVVAKAEIIDYMRHVARPHMFSASLPPAVVATVRKALDIFTNEPERRTDLLNNAKFMAKGLQGLGYNAKFNGTAVVPIYCGDEYLTLGLFNKLFREGVYVNPVLAPAVPKGKELLRTSYMAIHDKETLARALEIFKKVRTPYFPYNEHTQPDVRHVAREEVYDLTLPAV